VGVLGTGGFSWSGLVGRLPFRDEKLFPQNQHDDAEHYRQQDAFFHTIKLLRQMRKFGPVNSNTSMDQPFESGLNQSRDNRYRSTE
jgi:hypothetical protein